MRKTIPITAVMVFLVSFLVFASNQVSFIDQLKCVKCGTCFKGCPVKAISKIEKDGKVSFVVDPKKCINCGKCIKNCPTKSISLVDSSTVKFVLTDSSAVAPAKDTTKVATKEQNATPAKDSTKVATKKQNTTLKKSK
jgi:ferredoxin